MSQDLPILLPERIRSAFPLLTREDAGLLADIAETVTYHRNAPVILEGEHRQALFIIESGSVRAQKDVMAQVFTHMNPGQVFGEVSFIDNHGASLSVLADEDSVISIVEGFKLASLLQTVPGLSGRFYHSLALVLSERVRRLTDQVAPIV